MTATVVLNLLDGASWGGGRMEGVLAWRTLSNEMSLKFNAIARQLTIPSEFMGYESNATQWHQPRSALQ